MVCSEEWWSWTFIGFMSDVKYDCPLILFRPWRNAVRKQQEGCFMKGESSSKLLINQTTGGTFFLFFPPIFGHRTSISQWGSQSPELFQGNVRHWVKWYQPSSAYMSLQMSLWLIGDRKCDIPPTTARFTPTSYTSSGITRIQTRDLMVNWTLFCCANQQLWWSLLNDQAVWLTD